MTRIRKFGGELSRDGESELRSACDQSGIKPTSAKCWQTLAGYTEEEVLDAERRSTKAGKELGEMFNVTLAHEY